MQRECQRLQDLLDDFLNFAKVRRLNLQPTDLNARDRRDARLLRARGGGGGRRARALPRPRPAAGVLDARVVSRRAVQPVLNAKQAMPDGGQLVVRTTPARRHVVLDLIDTGCGMDDHTAAHMFEAFFSTKPGGSGLGLPTTRKIIEAHGGRIHVQSEVGHGTQVHDRAARAAAAGE